MTERKRAANLGRETPTIIKQSDSGPAGITEDLDNHRISTGTEREMAEQSLTLACDKSSFLMTVFVVNIRVQRAKMCNEERGKR